MSTIRVMSAGAVKAMVVALGAEFERETGNKLDLNFGTAGSLRDRIRNGETADVICLSASIIADLAGQGLVDKASVTDLGRTVTGIVVREGAAKPDISTVDAFKATLRNAKTFAYTDPKAGGSGGIMFAALLDRIGMADEVNRKAVLCKGGFDVSTTVAEGKAEIGTTFISEALPVKGLEVVGVLPGDLYNANTYTAALGPSRTDGARAFLKKLTDPAGRSRWSAAGLEPAF